MRLRLKRGARSRLGGLALGLAALGLSRPLVAEDRMTVRGNYYREASTRVLAPVVYVEKDVPDERFTVGAEYRSTR